MTRFLTFLLFLAIATAGCNVADLPLEFPSPPPPAPTGPVEKLELKRDAELEKQLTEIAKGAKGKVGVAAVVIDGGQAAILAGDQRFPMQSVYKLPIAMAVADQIRLGHLDLDEKVGVTKDEMVRPGMRSPLRDKNPNGGEFTIRELILLSLVESDGTASDVLMRLAGGPAEVQNFLTRLGVKDWRVANTEKEIGLDWKTQYENWATPLAAVDLLSWLDTARKPGNGESAPAGDSPGLATLARLLLKAMGDSVPGERRLKSLLPKGTLVEHKTGTGGTRDGISPATNDIGLITLPSGKRIAIAVFVSDSSADEKTREATIAKIARAVWDRWSGAQR